MDKKLDYKAIYALQDEALGVVKTCDTDFYLTGGTCLHRFVSPRRYSDDLDFFSGDAALFRTYAREVISALKKADLDVVTETDTRDFLRVRINGALRTDLVRDTVFRYGRSGTSPEGYRIDNIMNMLGNKLCALIGRDEPKDVFDIATIRDTADVDWSLALEIAGKKSSFERDYLVYRLQSFPVKMLDYLIVIKEEYRESCRKTLPLIIKELERTKS
jgi:predicted nucleotidyltransferase component of viral defense system